MSTPRTLEEQLSVAQVAERLGVDESTVWRWIAKGKIAPVRKLGRRITRVPASAVNRFLQERTVTE
jgi:excisionase family DNA binding protein